MDKIVEDLNKLAKSIEAAKKQKASLEGRQEELLNQLKGKFNINSIEEAEELLAVYEEQTKGLEKEITTKFNELKKNYNW